MPLELPVIRIAPNAPTFDLPVLVGLEQGFFNELGIDVQYSARYEDKENTLTEREVLSRLKESLYECGSADTFTLCEWGGIDRIERGSRGGRIGALRAAVTAQAILTFDKNLQEPGDLSGVPVGVNDYTGSHYTTLLMRYRGADVFAPNLTAQQCERYLEAINRAVDHINSDFGRYAHQIVEATKGRLIPEELSRNFIRYRHAQLYDPERLSRTHAWMQSWGLSPGRSDQATVVTH